MLYCVLRDIKFGDGGYSGCRFSDAADNDGDGCEVGRGGGYEEEEGDEGNGGD